MVFVTERRDGSDSNVLLEFILPFTDCRSISFTANHDLGSDATFCKQSGFFEHDRGFDS